MDSFDAESGLVFRESIIRRDAYLIPWAHQTTRSKASYTPPAQGVRSLYDISVYNLVCNAPSLLPETLEALPPVLVLQIWRAIRRESNENFHVWKTFADSGNGDRSFVHHVNLTTYANPFVDLFADLTSISFAWMTDLTLCDAPCSTPDLKQLPVLVNLQNLQIRSSKNSLSIVNDGLLKQWALRAKEAGAFSRLGLISISNAPGVTSKIFDWLSWFPALDTIILCLPSLDRPINRKLAMRSGKQSGWSSDVGGRFWSFISALLVRGNCEKSRTRYQFDDSVDDYIRMRRSHKAESCPDVPILVATLADSNRSLHNTISYAFGKTLCFERDWSFECPSSAEKTSSSSISSTDRLCASLPVKRQKLRGTKAILLDSVLGSL